MVLVVAFSGFEKLAGSAIPDPAAVSLGKILAKDRLRLLTMLNEQAAPVHALLFGTG